MADSPPRNTEKRSVKSPKSSTKALRLDQLSPDTQKDRRIQFMVRHGRPLTRENYIRLAGLLEEEGDFAQLPEEFKTTSEKAD
jgi:hypothetical protein